MSKIDQYNFVVPGQDIQKSDPEWDSAANLSKEALQQRWLTEEGRAKLERIRAAKLNRRELGNIIGRFNGHFDLRGIDLSGIDLSSSDLSQIDFFGANLARCNCQQSNMDGTFLSECDIRGTRFDWASMEGVYLDNVKFDTKTSFHGVDLNRINFTLAALLHEQALSQQRIEHLKQRHPLFAFLLLLSSDYGRSITRFFITCLIVIFIFSLIYIYIFELSINDAIRTSILAFLGLTNPDGSIAYLVMLEAAAGYFFLALLAAILVRKTMGS